jgi:hypothetical protein
MNFDELRKESTLTVLDKIGEPLTGVEKAERVATILLNNSIKAMTSDEDETATDLSFMLRDLAEIADAIDYTEKSKLPLTVPQFSKLVSRFKVLSEGGELSDDDKKAFLSNIVEKGLQTISSLDDISDLGEMAAIISDSDYSAEKN